MSDQVAEKSFMGLPILAFDCAGNDVSVAVMAADGTMVIEKRDGQSSAAEILVPLIDRVLAEAQLSYGQLGLIAVSVGPGSFTGIRIGLAAAKSLALATGIRAVGISRFAAALAGAKAIAEPDRGRYLVALDTKRGDAYVQSFSPGGQVEGEPCILSTEKIIADLHQDDFRLVTDMDDIATACPGSIQMPFPPPFATMAGCVAGLALRDPAQHLPLQPVYLRPAEVSQAKFRGFVPQ